jgi:o-succinylbenzoate---CoA ligase
MHTSTASAARPLNAVEVPLGPAVLQRILPAVDAALRGGPALLPIPARPVLVRTALLAAMRPDEPVETVDHDEVALVVPTSGSTGDPKGVLLGVTGLTAAAAAAHEQLGGSGRWLLALPATHVGGLMVLVRSVVAGTTPDVVDLTAGFDPVTFAAAGRRFLGRDAARRYTALVPRQLAVVLEAGGAALEVLTAFDAVLVGGSSAAPDLLARARTAGVHVVTSYGMTETCGGVVYDGLPLTGVQIAIAPTGRIKISGPVLAHGYRRQPELTTQTFVDGWFVSSDLGRIEEDGRLSVLGRTDDVAVTGGVNVPLAAVDALVAGHPGVAAAATVALPDPSWGQRVMAVVVPRDPANPPTLASIRAHVASRAPAAHAPTALVLAEALPMLAGGQVDRTALVARLLETTTA